MDLAALFWLWKTSLMFKPWGWTHSTYRPTDLFFLSRRTDSFPDTLSINCILTSSRPWCSGPGKCLYTRSSLSLPSTTSLECALKCAIKLYTCLVYTHSVILVIQAIWLVRFLGLWRYFTAVGGEYKAEQNRCREVGVLRKFHGKNFLKIQEYPSIDDLEGKKRLHGV